MPQARTLTVEEIARYAYAAGFRGQALVTAVAIAFPESGGNANAHNPNRSTGDNSYGLMQINMIDKLGPARRKQFGISSNEQLWNPLTNMKAAFIVSGGGKNFSPWTTYKKGAHRPHMQKALQAVRSLGENVGTLPETTGLPGGGESANGGIEAPAGPVLPTEEEVRNLFQQLLGYDPNDMELARYTGKTSMQAKELMLETDDALEMSIMRGADLLRREMA